jgi:glycosyltransferase involved in cell wall biosynthesis
MKIGAYICNHNYGRFLQWAVRSMARQTKRPDMIIFIDDCSTDNSMDILDREIAKNGSIFDDILMHSENKGASKTMNEAVDYLIAHGCECVFGLSADDVLEDTFVEKTYNTLLTASKNVGYVYTHVRKIGDRQGNDIHPEFSSDLLFRYPYVHGSSLVKAVAWKDVGGLPEKDFEEDYDMFKRMAYKGWYGKLCPEVLLNWRWHGKNRTIQGLKQRMENNNV